MEDDKCYFSVGFIHPVFYQVLKFGLDEVREFSVMVDDILAWDVRGYGLKWPSLGVFGDKVVEKDFLPESNEVARSGDLEFVDNIDQFQE